VDIFWNSAYVWPLPQVLPGITESQATGYQLAPIVRFVTVFSGPYIATDSLPVDTESSRLEEPGGPFITKGTRLPTRTAPGRALEGHNLGLIYNRS
jgi:hypothetical protein